MYFWMWQKHMTNIRNVLQNPGIMNMSFMLPKLLIRIINIEISQFWRSELSKVMGLLIFFKFLFTIHRRGYFCQNQTAIF